MLRQQKKTPRCIVIAGPNGAGKHDVSRPDVLRRFDRGWRNFSVAYKALADEWAVYDNSGTMPELLERGP